MSLVLTFLWVRKIKPVSGILPKGNYLPLWNTFSSWKEYSTGLCTWVRKSHLEGTATNIYKRVPISKIWLRIADEFNDICKMLNFIRSRDRKHCRIKYPPNAGSLYFNYKSFHSVNLLGVADATDASHWLM